MSATRCLPRPHQRGVIIAVRLFVVVVAANFGFWPALALAADADPSPPPGAERYLYSVGLAQREWLENHIERTEEILTECPEELRGWEWYYLQRLCHGELVRFTGHPYGPWGVTFSPDGRLGASSSVREVKVWEADSGRELKTLEASQSGWVAGVAFSPDGKSFCATGFKSIKIWDTDTWKERLAILDHDFLVGCVAHSPDGKRLATCSGVLGGSGGGRGGEIKIWDATTGEQLLAIRESKWVNAVTFSPDGRWLASGSGDLSVMAPEEPGRLVIWDAETGAEYLELKGHTFWITSVAFSPDGRYLASGSADRTIKIWDLSSGKLVHTLEGHQGWVRSITYSPDGAQLASGGDDRCVRLWDTNTGKEVGLLRGHKGEIRAVAMSPDGRHLAVASQRRVERKDGLPTSIGEVKVWSLNAGQASKALSGHDKPVRSVAFSPDGAYLASASEGYSTAEPGRVIIHELNGRRVRHVLPMQGFGANHLSFDTDGHILVAMGGPGSWPEESQAWNPETGQAVSSLPAAAFSADGLLAASATTVWEVATGNLRCQLKGHKLKDHVTGVAFSPDNRRVATANWGGYYRGIFDGKETNGKAPNEVKVWDARTGENLLTLPGGGRSVAWSLDGRYIASGDRDGTVKVWAAEGGRLVYTLRRHADGVQCVAFSPDGQRLVSGSGDHTLKVWDLATGLETLTLSDHTGSVTCVAFSPDGHLIASCGEDQTVRLWDATP